MSSVGGGGSEKQQWTGFFQVWGWGQFHPQLGQPIGSPTSSPKPWTVDTGLVRHLNLYLNMKLFGLLSLAAATLGMNLKEPVVNEVIDMVESGLGESKEGRALFITLTLTESTW